MLRSKHLEDRRSPPLFQVKKICIESTDCNSNQLGKVQSSYETCKKKRKTVTFNDEKLEEVIEFEDDAESKSLRKLYWESVAADRVRFRDRCDRLENILAPVLSATHRNVVYVHRVMKSSIASCSSYFSISTSTTTRVEENEIEMVVAKNKIDN